MTEEQFNQICWPDEFIIEYVNGKQQVFISEIGVCWDSGSDEIEEDENRVNINCCWKKKSPSQQRHKLIQVWVDEINNIKSLNGEIIWINKT